MPRKRYLKIKIVSIITVFLVLLLAQEGQVSFLSQKLLLENNLRDRITNALDKLLEDIKFIVDVKVEIEFTSAERTESVYQIPREVTKAGIPEEKLKPEPEIKAKEEDPKPTITPGTELSLPLPGFETPPSLVRPIEAKEEPAAEEEEKPEMVEIQAPEETRIVSKSIHKPSIPIIKRQEVSIILEDGINPNIIENVRQIVSIAAHHDKSRGDIINIMTTSFEKKEEQDAAEAIILKNIAEKIDELERKQSEAERRARIEEQKRLERQAVMRDSLRISDLTWQIEELRQQSQSQQLTEEQRKIKEMEASTSEQELITIRDQLRESNRKLQELEMSTLETTPPERARQNLYFIAIAIGGLAILIMILILLLNRKTRRRQEMEWGYGAKIPMGPRPQEQPPKTPAAPPTPTPQPEAEKQPPKKPESPPEDLAAQKEEAKALKQSVISMSVGKPNTASRILRDWLSEGPSTSEAGSEIEEGGE